MGDDPFSFGDFVYGTGGNAIPEAPSAVPAEPDDVNWPSDTTGLTGGALGASPGLRIAGPPFRWLWACAVAAAVAFLGAAVLGDRAPVAIAAWIVSGPLAFTLLGRFSTGDSVAQASPVYQRPRWTRGAYAAVAVLALLAIVVCALRLGLWWGHL